MEPAEFLIVHAFFMFAAVKEDADGDQDHQGNPEHEQAEMLLQQGVAGFPERLRIELPLIGFFEIGGGGAEIFQSLIGLPESPVGQFVSAVLAQDRLPGSHCLLVFAVRTEQRGAADILREGGR